MPQAAKKPCTYPMCPALTTGGRCEQHKRKEQEKYDSSRLDSGKRGYDSVWQRVRSLKLSRDPLCEEHLRQGHDVVAVLVHHVEPIEKRPELRLDLGNLMSLCQPCHEDIHGKQRWGR